MQVDQRVCDNDMPAPIARSSSYREGALRWTVLSIYAVEQRGGMVFVFEIVGATTVEGEQRRERRRAFATLAKALNWSELDFQSKLYGQLQSQAIDWMESQARAAAGRAPRTVMLDEADGTYRFMPVETGAPRFALITGDNGEQLLHDGSGTLQPDGSIKLDAFTITMKGN